MLLLSIFISICIGFYLGMYYNKKDYDKKYDENTQRLNRYISFLQKIKDEHISSADIINGLQSSLRIKERELQQYEKKISELKKEIKALNRKKKLPHILYEDFYSYRTSIRRNENNHTEKCVELTNELIDILYQLEKLQDDISRSIKTHKIKYDDISSQEEKEIAIQDKEYHEKHPNIEIFIDWNRPQTFLYFNSIIILTSAYNFITFILNQIYTINLINIPPERLNYIPRHKYLNKE